MSERIKNIEQFAELWTRIYKTDGKPDWSHILPYYHEDIYFRDSIQEIRGIKAFTAMTERLTERSKELEFRAAGSNVKQKLRKLSHPKRKSSTPRDMPMNTTGSFGARI